LREKSVAGGASPRPAGMPAPSVSPGYALRLGEIATLLRQSDKQLQTEGHVMNDSRARRWLIWTGPLFAVLFLVVTLVLEGDTPGEKASGAEVMKHFNSHQGRTLIEVFLAPLAATLLVLFAGEIRTRARERGQRGTGPTALLGGAVLFAASMLSGAALSLALVTASDHKQSQVAETLNVLSNDSWIPFIGGIAIFLIGAGMTALSTGLLPKWLAWVALVGGVVSLAGPGGFVGYFVAPLWMLVAGIVLAVRTERAEAVTPMQPAPSVV
jgi:magnesium-transporting ATPase (P-type)